MRCSSSLRWASSALQSLILHVVAGQAGFLPLPGDARETQHADQNHAAHKRRGHRTVPGPLPQPFVQPHRPGLDRLALAEAVQILGQGLGGRISLGRFLGQALEDDRLQIARQIAPQITGANRVLVQHQQNGIERSRPAKRGPAGEKFIENGPQGVNVRGGADGQTGGARLLGGHVAGSADDVAAVRPLAALVQAFGQSEVGDLRQSGLQIAQGGLTRAVSRKRRAAVSN